jgi:hypothetical protein
MTMIPLVFVFAAIRIVPAGKLWLDMALFGVNRVPGVHAGNVLGRDVPGRDHEKKLSEPLPGSLVCSGTLVALSKEKAWAGWPNIMVGTRESTR